MIHYRCGGNLTRETHHVRGWSIDQFQSGNKIGPSDTPEPYVYRCDRCGLAGIVETHVSDSQ